MIARHYLAATVAVAAILAGRAYERVAPAAQTTSSDSEPPASITADISGDYTEHFSAKGVAVQGGAAGSINKGTAHFVIAGLIEGPPQRTDLSAGFITDVGGIGGMTHFPGFLVGTRQDATGSYLRIQRGEEDEVIYDDGDYWLFYDTQPERRPYGHVTFLKADKLASDNRYLVRYHLVGTFDFVAAYAPTPSGACVQEALEYIRTHDAPRHPMYKAELCQAKKIAVKGSFDIIGDLPSDFVE